MSVLVRVPFQTLAFMTAMEVIKRVSGGERLQERPRLPPIQHTMDDVTTLTTTAPCTCQPSTTAV